MSQPIEAPAESTVETQPVEVEPAEVEPVEVEPVEEAPEEEQPDLAALEAERALAEANERAQAAEEVLARREEQLAELRLTMLKNQVADDTGVPAGLLHGSSVEELEAHSNQLLQWKAVIEKGAAASMPRGPLRSGYVREDRAIGARAQAVGAVRQAHQYA